jgi:hypothetical protein
VVATNYCRWWNGVDKEAVDPYSEEQARERHEKHEEYTALIADGARPTSLVAFNERRVRAMFLDKQLREIVSYSFRRSESGMLFLSTAMFQEYKWEEFDNYAWGIQYLYKERGPAHVQKIVQTSESVEVFEADPTLGVSANWEPFPKFGDYESITRLERGLNLIHDKAG